MTVILTVEDEFLISEYLGHVLEEAGWNRCQNKVNSWRSLTPPNEFWRLFGARRSEAAG